MRRRDLHVGGPPVRCGGRGAVLVDRGGRELPIGATYGVWDVDLSEGQNLVLARSEAGELAWRLENA